MPVCTPSEWEHFLSQHTQAHLLQSAAWGELKAAFGWEVARLAVGDTGAQILFRRLPLGLSLAYIPKGPVGPAWENLWPQVDELCRRQRAVFLKVEPDLWEGANGNRRGSPPPGFRLSPQTIQPPRTLVVDLRGDEAQVLARMKQKTRYNVRLALKKNIVVRHTSDLETFHRLMVITGQRDEFGVHSLEYFKRTYDLFHPHGACELLLAEYQQQPLAALMVFARQGRAWYFYGASANEHREYMPTYILQWEAMRWARLQGCSEYDLWGVPDADQDRLEAEFTQRSDDLWGVYRFKRGFGGELRRAAGPWDRVYNPVLYAFYRYWLKARQLES